MSISVLKAGIYDTIQDFGRMGYSANGINPGGVMDRLAMQVANALTGNRLDGAVIEMHFPAPVLYFNEPAVIALSGADFDATILETNRNALLPLPVNKAAFIPAGVTLTFRNKLVGERAYLSIQNGFDVPVLLGSYSTNTSIKAGGFDGRLLAAGDKINLCGHPADTKQNALLFPWRANLQSWYDDPAALNFIAGPEWNWMEPSSQKLLLQKPLKIDLHSDRIGIGLTGSKFGGRDNTQLVSGGVNYGTIQLLPAGNLIVLAADHPTTGGYPRIANIITAHLPKLAQAAPGAAIRLLQTSVENAALLLIQMQKELKQLQQAVGFRLASL